MALPAASGLLQFAATLLSICIIGMQIASVAGNGVYYASFDEGNVVTRIEVGFFNRCESTYTEQSRRTCTVCNGQIERLDEEGAQAPFCPNERDGPTNENIEPFYRASQAMSIITILCSAGHFAAILLVVCDKIQNPLLTIASGTTVFLGALTAVSMYLHALNVCGQSYCDQLQVQHSDVAVHCVASYTVYCELFSGVFAVVTGAMLLIAKKIADQSTRPVVAVALPAGQNNSPKLGVPMLTPQQKS